MPSNRAQRKRKMIRELAAEIPADLLQWLRFGTSPDRQPGEQPSDEYGDVIFFNSAEESLAWLSEAWRKHEAFIRQGVDGDPFILEEMQRLRKFIEAGRKWQGE